MALAVGLIVVWPLVYDDRLGPVVMGVPVMVTMIVLLALGLGWLIWLVTVRQRQRRGR